MRFPHGTILLLGLVTIASYGAWFYAFGVLFDPILTDTDWPESGLAATFSLAAAIGAVSSIPAGRFVDRYGSRSSFLAAATVSTVGLWTASTAQEFLAFAVPAVIGGASLQGLAFYHVTQATAVRAAPSEPTRAIALLTIYGAFSSAIYLPLAAFMEASMGWRQTMRILVVSTAAVLVVGAILVREGPRSAGTRSAPAFGPEFRRPAARRFVIGSSLAGFAVGAMLVYQVPLMTGAGLSVGVAAWMAGARGAAQITGRIPLSFIVARIGARSSVRLSFLMITVSVLLLSVAGNVFIALIYVAVAGFGIGANSPLQGIYANDLFDKANLGASMGVITMAFGLSSAFGPMVVGLLADLSGNRWWGVALATVFGLAAVSVMGETTARVEPAATPSAEG